MKYLILLLLVILFVSFSSCGSCSKWNAEMTGHSEVVIDGVVYLQFSSGVTVKYNTDGTICTRK
jgi:hypothetical protein